MDETYYRPIYVVILAKSSHTRAIGERSDPLIGTYSHQLHGRNVHWV